MANRFWVGGTGTWNTTTTHWSATSNGSSGATVPVAGDDVFFDSHSGSGTATISGSRVCNSLNCTGYTGTLATGSGGLSIGSAVAGASNVAFLLVAGMTYTDTAGFGLSFVSTSGTTQTITCAGHTSPGTAITVNGAGCSYQLADDFLCGNAVGNNNFTLTTGTFAINGHTIKIGSFVSTGTNTRSFDMTNGTVNMGGAWNITASLSLTTTGSTIIVIAGGGTFTGGGRTYNNLTINSTGGSLLMTGSNTWNNVIVNPPFNPSLTGWEFNKAVVTQTITNLTCNGTYNNPIYLNNSTTGLAAQVTFAISGTATFNYTWFANMTLTGAATPVTLPLGCVDGGQNSGITFTGPYYKQQGSGSNGGNSVAITWGGNTTTGNVIVVAIFMTHDVLNSPTITDSQGNVYTQLAFNQIGTAAFDFCLFYTNGITGGTTPTVTVNTGGATLAYIGVRLFEITNVTRSIPVVDQSAYTSNDTNTASTSTQFPQANNELIMAFNGGNSGSALAFTGLAYVTDKTFQGPTTKAGYIVSAGMAYAQNAALGSASNTAGTSSFAAILTIPDNTFPRAHLVQAGQSIKRASIF